MQHTSEKHDFQKFVLTHVPLSELFNCMNFMCTHMFVDPDLVSKFVAKVFAEFKIYDMWM